MKLKKHKTCKECPSCINLNQNGNYYCNIMVTDSNHPDRDISWCTVDLDSKRDDCPWDKISETIETLSRDDQIGLRCLAKMFSGEGNDLFEDDPPCDFCENPKFTLVIKKWHENEKKLSEPYFPNFCPECGRKLR